MMAIYGPLQLILSVVYFIMIVHIIMSWLINFQVLNLHQQFVAQIWYGINRLLEPIYTPLRRILPNTHPLGSGAACGLAHRDLSARLYPCRRCLATCDLLGCGGFAAAWAPLLG
ncbi:MAG: hypothetical protein EpisKO_27930 [Epibacterium sp.]